jgi:hypothetical protein
MVAGTMHLMALVDSQVGSFVGELDDSISFTHSLQLLVPKVFTQESGSPCHRMSTLTLTKSLTFFLVVPSGTRDVKCNAKESELLLLMKRFLMS